MSQNTKKPYDLPDWPAEAEQTQEAPRPRRKRRAPAEPEDLWGKLRFRAGKKVRWFGRRCRRVVREAQAHRFPESNRKPLQFLLMLWGLLPFGVTQVYASTLREVGETRLPMLASVAAILVNLVFNYFLIFGKCGFPEMGVTGAAIATVLSRYIETAIIVVYTHTRKEYFPFIHGAYRSLRVPSPLMSGILRRGTPLLVNEFLWSSGMAVLLQCYSVRGLDVVAACNIATTVSNLFKVVFLSMGNAVAIMVGQALGANDIERAKNCTWRLMMAAVGSNLFMSILLILFAPSIPHIYNTEPHVRQIATQLLYVIAMMMPAYSFSHCCYFTLRSGGKTIITFLFDSVFTWCVNVPTAWLLAYRTGMGIVPLYFCVQALELIKVVIGFALVKKGVWIHNIVAPVAEKEAAEK